MNSNGKRMSDEPKFDIFAPDVYFEKYEPICKLISLYESFNPTGGNLHIVLADENLEDGHVRFCIGEAEKENDHIGVAVGRMLLTLTEDEREAVIAHSRNYPYL